MGLSLFTRGAREAREAELRIERIAREAQAGRTEGELHLRYAAEHAELMQLRAEMEAIRSAGTDEVRTR